MNLSPRQLLLVSTTSLLALMTACSPPTVSDVPPSSPVQSSSVQSSPVQATASTQSASVAVAEASGDEFSDTLPVSHNTAVEPWQDAVSSALEKEGGDGTAIAVAAANAECMSWQAYKQDVSDPTGLPNVPVGFENGCIFGTNLAGESSTAPVSIYILRDGIALDRVFDPSVLASASMDTGFPNIERRSIEDSSGFAHELITEGNAMIFNYGDPRSCEMLGGLNPDGYYNTSENNCGFASPQRAHFVDTDHPVVCFGISCLETFADMPVEELRALWEPWQVPTANPTINAVRSQYSSMDLNSLSPELRRAIFHSQLESLLMDEFGRTTLDEGEKPTTIIQDDSMGKDYWYLHISTVINEGLPDDSVGGFRYRLEFEPYDGDTLLLVWAGSQQFCRRTQEWTNQLCP